MCLIFTIWKHSWTSNHNGNKEKYHWKDVCIIHICESGFDWIMSLTRFFCHIMHRFLCEDRKLFRCCRRKERPIWFDDSVPEYKISLRDLFKHLWSDRKWEKTVCFSERWEQQPDMSPPCASSERKNTTQKEYKKRERKGASLVSTSYTHIDTHLPLPLSPLNAD